MDCCYLYVCYMKSGLLHEKWFANWKQLILMLGSSTLVFLVKWNNFEIGSVLILIPYIIIPLFISKKPKRWILITFILDNVFQILSNLARGNALIINDTALIRDFMFIDYYLMFIIYYIGGCHMGMGSWLPWFTKKETVIDAKIEKLQCKIKKLEEKKIELKSKCLKK